MGWWQRITGRNNGSDLQKWGQRQTYAYAFKESFLNLVKDEIEGVQAAHTTPNLGMHAADQQAPVVEMHAMEAEAPATENAQEVPQLAVEKEIHQDPTTPATPVPQATPMMSFTDHLRALKNRGHVEPHPKAQAASHSPQTSEEPKQEAQPSGRAFIQALRDYTLPQQPVISLSREERLALVRAQNTEPSQRTMRDRQVIARYEALRSEQRSEQLAKLEPIRHPQQESVDLTPARHVYVERPKTQAESELPQILIKPRMPVAETPQTTITEVAPVVVQQQQNGHHRSTTALETYLAMGKTEREAFLKSVDSYVMNGDGSVNGAAQRSQSDDPFIAKIADNLNKHPTELKAYSSKSEKREDLGYGKPSKLLENPQHALQLILPALRKKPEFGNDSRSIMDKILEATNQYLHGDILINEYEKTVNARVDEILCLDEVKTDRFEGKFKRQLFHDALMELPISLNGEKKQLSERMEPMRVELHTERLN